MKLSCLSYKNVQISCRHLLQKAKYKNKKHLNSTVMFSQEIQLISYLQEKISYFKIKHTGKKSNSVFFKKWHNIFYYHMENQQNPRTQLMLIMIHYWLIIFMKVTLIHVARQHLTTVFHLSNRSYQMHMPPTKLFPKIYQEIKTRVLKLWLENWVFCLQIIQIQGFHCTVII